MKKIEKELLLLDLDNNKTLYERKINFLDTIILYFIDSEESQISNTEKNIDDKKDELIKEDSENESKENNNSNNEEKNIEIKKEKIEGLLSSDIKMLFRKIMMVTHPDKTNDNNFLKELYKNAITAKNENNETELLFIAYKLKIKELFDIDDIYFEKIKDKITSIKQDVNSIENSPYWVWYHTDNINIRNLLKLHISNKRKI